MDAKEYVSLLFPNGKAYANVKDSKKFNEVIALQINRVVSWIQNFQDQLWFANENFDPEPWEKRYNIDVPPGATLEERRQTVKSYMSFPLTAERMSLDYLQGQLDLAGFSDVIISKNPTGTPSGKLHGNNVTSSENYTIGPDSYNSINITGNIQDNYYESMLLLLMNIKPLETAVYDTVEFTQAMAYDPSLALALDDNFTLAISEI